MIMLDEFDIARVAPRRNTLLGPWFHTRFTLVHCHARDTTHAEVGKQWHRAHAVCGHQTCIFVADAHVRIFSLDLLNVVRFLFDCEWLELRYCPANAMNRTAYECAHRARWLRFMRTTIEFSGPSRTRECATDNEA